VIEYPLQSEWHAFGGVLVFGWYLIHSLELFNVSSENERPTATHHLSEITHAEKGLKENIHVTSCTLINQANIASFLL
jgi:hypothetical protein